VKGRGVENLRDDLIKIYASKIASSQDEETEK
jgi:hypothetical protein